MKTPRMTFAWPTGLFLASTLTMTTAHGQSVTVDNGGFEVDVLQEDESIAGTGSGWTGGGIPNSWGAWHPPAAAYPGQAPEGSNVGWLYVDPPDGEASFLQTLSHTLEADTTYTLSVNVGNPQTYFSSFCPCTYDFTGFPGYRVELWAGGVLIAQDDDGVLPAEGTFERVSISYTVAAGDPLIGTPLEIRLVNKNAGPGLEVDFDGVELIRNCGTTQYGVGASPVNVLDLSGNGTAGLGTNLQLITSNLKAEAPGAFTMLSFGQADFPIFGGSGLVNPLTEVMTVFSPAVAGTATWDLAVPSTVPAGLVAYCQSMGQDSTQPAGWGLSNGLQIVVCP